VARKWLLENAPGPVALFVPEATHEDFSGIPVFDRAANSLAAVVVGDFGEAWTFETLNRAFTLLMKDSKPALVALGMTRYWRSDSGLRLDAGPFIKALEYAAGCTAAVMGKPSGLFFQIALESVGCKADDAIMIGDDIVGDVHAAQLCGLRGILVRTGKFRPADLKGKIVPHAVLDSIADLPAWWVK
jgi:HAD superfamily hydrolase (TIGR01458 family)